MYPLDIGKTMSMYESGIQCHIDLTVHYCIKMDDLYTFLMNFNSNCLKFLDIIYNVWMCPKM